MNDNSQYPAALQADATHEIKRTSNAFLDSILGHSFPVLDHGFIRVIDYMGDDAAIVQAARVSYGSGTKAMSDESGLIRYLMRQHHTTPFEMCEIKLHVKLPVFVARQWIRHRTANVNEYSARYSILDREFYIPEAAQMAVQSTDNKQGRGEVLSEADAELVRNILRQDAERSYDSYAAMINDDEGGLGLARELARINLPTNIYTQWYWKTDLHNLLHFLRLRADGHAQWEIRQYANVMCSLVGAWVPQAFQAFSDYVVNAKSFSNQEMVLIRQMVHGYQVSDERAKSLGLSQREINDFRKKIEARQ